jgi:hypothetical protein
MTQKIQSFADKIIAKKKHLIHKISAVDITGKQAYYFVLIEPHKEMLFNMALKSGRETINFEDYGSVIASCYGDKPNEEVKKILKDKYDFDID